DEESRARRHLQIAATRLYEVEQLACNAERPRAPEVFTSAMDDFDEATNEGSQLLLSAAEQDQAAAEDLRRWAAEQSDKLEKLEPELPPSADADTSRQLLERLLGRTTSLDTEEDNSRRTAGESEDESDSEDSGGSDTTREPDDDEEESSPKDSSRTSEPSRSSERTTDRENPRLLPDLSPNKDDDEDEKPSGTATKDEDGDEKKSESDSDDSDGGAGNVPVPLPLLPPVTLPPLLPGLPGITIG